MKPVFSSNSKIGSLPPPPALYLEITSFIDFCILILTVLGTTKYTPYKQTLNPDPNFLLQYRVLEITSTPPSSPGEHLYLKGQFMFKNHHKPRDLT